MASQLLNEHSAPSYTSAKDVLSNARPADLPSISATFGIQGAVVTASTSFSIAWLLNWSRSRGGSSLNSRKVGVLLILVPVLGMLFYAFARRQWLKYLRHQAVDAAVALISNSQAFDSAASGSVVFIQEVELVSRGYRMYDFLLDLEQADMMQKHPHASSEQTGGPNPDAAMPQTTSDCVRVPVLDAGTVHSVAARAEAVDRRI